MKFHVGEVPKSAEFDSTGFTLLREPSEAVFERIVGMLFVMLLLTMAVVWAMTGAVDWPDSIIQIAWQSLLTAVLLIPLHEAIHAVMYPHTKPGIVVFGFWPKKKYFYATFTGQLSRTRSILAYVAPFSFCRFYRLRSLRYRKFILIGLPWLLLSMPVSHRLIYTSFTFCCHRYRAMPGCRTTDGSPIGVGPSQ